MLYLKEKNSVLNIGAGPGRILPEVLKQLQTYFLINLDVYYPEESCSSITEIGNKYKEWLKKYTSIETFRSNTGWEEFISKYAYPVSYVTMYRYLEHVRMTQVPYFLYMVSTILKDGGLVEGIVPDYDELARRILSEQPKKDKNFEAKNILHTTELLNEPEDPHCSIWTADRLEYFFTLEGRFKVIDITDNYKFDGRDIYLKFIMERIS